MVKVSNLKKGPQQKALLGFFQELNYLYPDMHLFQALRHFQVACAPFDEVAIGNKLKSRYMVCWNVSSYAGNPPNGEFMSEDEDTIVVKACYNVPISFSEGPGSGEWLNVKQTTGNLFSTVLHLPRNGEPSDEVVCVFESKNEVLFWVCPKCSMQNKGMSCCSACNAPLPDAVVGIREENEK